jgi:protein-glutamine gamma-glutamyltransferase
MRTPPLLMAMALLFWGWQSGFLLAAALLAVLLECSRVVGWRWDTSSADINRIWDLCGILFILAAVHFYTSEQLTESAYALFQTLPLVFFPIAAAQVFGTRDDLEVRTFSYLLRDKEEDWLLKRINITWIYFAVCLVSASASNRNTEWFYGGFVGLTVAALWCLRPRRFSALITAVFLGIIVLAGHQTHQRLHSLQANLEGAVGEWLAGLVRKDLNARESRTAIGQMGRLKLSGRIILRVESGNGSPPALLRDASYNVYRSGTWLAALKEFGPVLADGPDSWLLISGKPVSESVTISGYLKHLRNHLPLPPGTAELTQLPVAGIEQSAFGVVRIAEGPGLLRYTAYYGPGRTSDFAPVTEDLYIPEQERRTIRRLAAKLGLHEMSLDEKLEAVSRFFESEFAYSTWISHEHVDMTGTRTPLQVFLEEARSGHCEYFATATVLLLRAADVPVRYATGYAVEAADRRGNTYLVRERHGHAWCLVYRGDGVWEDFDTTPPLVEQAESHSASFWEPVSDFLSAAWYRFSRWRWGDSNYRQYLIWTVIPLLLVLAWRIVFTMRRHRREDERRGRDDLAEYPGLDSEFYEVERKLTELGLLRAPHETPRHWVVRAERELGMPSAWLAPAVELHYRYRFDPNGLSAAEREQLRHSVENWLRHHPQNA